MEVTEMGEGKKAAAAAKMTSAAAFVEGGIQDECEDACSICLEEFTSSDPSTLTNCRHEFHLQCILEWCQRSSDCPMCLQPVSLKDPTSQELFEAVEQERKVRAAATRNPVVFRHPTLGDFNLQHLPSGASNAELESRIIQHLAAAMGRAHFGRRETHRSRSNVNNAPSSGLVLSRVGREIEPVPINVATPSTPLTRSDSPDSTAGPSQESFSESLKSRLSSVSMRYRESLSRSARGWAERFPFFSRSSSMSDIGSRSPPPSSTARSNGTDGQVNAA